MIRKFVACLLVLSFLVGGTVPFTFVTAQTITPIVSTGVFEQDLECVRNAYTGRLKDSVLDETLSYVAADSSMRELHSEDPAEVINIICGSLDVAIRIMETQESTIQPRSGSYPNYYTNITPVQQKNNYYCGPAAGTQAMIGAGILTYGASQSSYLSAQNAMGSLMKTDKNGYTAVADMQYGLNQFLSANSGGNKPYTILWITSEMDMYTLATRYIGNSIFSNRPVVVNTLLNRLPYYTGSSTSGHD